MASDLLNVVNAAQSLTQFALVAVFSVEQSIHDLKPEVLTWIVLQQNKVKFSTAPITKKL